MSQAVPVTDPNNFNNSSAALSSSNTIRHKLNIAGAQATQDTQAQPQGDGKSSFQKVSDAEGDFSTGLAKGALSTLKGMGTLGTKFGDLISRGIEKLGGPKDLLRGSDIYRSETETGKKAEEFVTPKNTAESIGKGAEQIGEFFVPAGAVDEVQKTLTGGINIAEKLAPHIGAKSAGLVEAALKAGTKMAVRAGEGGGIIGIQSGGDKEQTESGAKYGAILSGVGSLVSPVLKKALAPFAKSFDSTTKAFFDSEGIKAPVSALNKNKGVQNIEAVASKTLFGGDINETAQKAVEQLDSKTNKIIEGLKPTKSMSDESLGKMLQTGLHDYETNFKQTEDKVYEEFSKKYGMAPSRPISTQTELASILGQQKEDLYKGINPTMQKMFTKMGEDSPDIKKLEDGLRRQGVSDDIIEKKVSEAKAEHPPFEMTFNQLKNTRTSVGEALANDPQNTALKRLYGAISKDMETTVSFDKTGADQLAKINTAYKAGKDKIESRIAQSVIMSNPEKIADNIIQRNSADTVNQLKEMVGAERFKEVSKHFVSNLVDKATTESGKFKVEKLKSAIDSYDQETLDAVLSKDEQSGIKQGIDQLEKLNAMTEATKAGAKAATGSQTAFLANSAGSATALATGITTALTTGNFAILGALTAKVGGEYALAKFIASDVGRKILTEGINPENSKVLNTLKPAIRSVIMELTRQSPEEDTSNQ